MGQVDIETVIILPFTILTLLIEIKYWLQPNLLKLNYEPKPNVC